MQKFDLRFVAETPEAQHKGLMFQPPLKPYEAALFKFSTPQLNYFWNRNVMFPIDVAFFNELGKLINIERLAANQEEPVFPVGAYRYVIEAPLNALRNKVPFGTHYTELING